ncbi:MAG: beta-lactamase family protein [Polyangiaceae bacterium]|nr:beta-lactamase family protein [Polyangiaceae bacterium]
MNTNHRAGFGLSFILIVPFLSLTSLAGCSDDPIAPAPPPELGAELRADLQATLDQAVAEGSAPGAALYVSGKDGTWAGAAGVADIEGNIPLAPGDRFRTGSILKTLVATAVLQNVEEGALALDDVLTDRLPEAVTARIQGAKTIDIEMLLGHRSGIPDWVTPAVRQMVVTDPAHIWSLDEVLGSVEGQSPAFNPGEAYGYSNTNYVLLGEILSAVEGRSFREAVRDRVITRAGMADTTLPEPGDIECPSCARGYVAMNGEMLDTTDVDPSMAGASGGHALISTAADLARFFERLQAGALFDRSETLAAMLAFQPAVDDGDVGGNLIGYGLGVMQLDMDGEKILGHLGGTAGYQGFMLYLPSTERYVSGFINVMGDPGALITPAVSRLAQP